MKKLFIKLFIFVLFVFEVSAQEAVSQLNVTMVDGVQVNMSFFKKWKEASKFMKENEPTAAAVLVHYYNGEVKVKDSRKSKDDWILSPVGLDAKNENEIGNLVNKDYLESDNAEAAKILTILKETECEFGVGFVNFGDKIVRYVVALKGKKLRVNRYNYYKPSNEDYQALIEKDLSAEAKRNKAIEKVMKNILPDPGSVNTGVSSEQELYRLRHKTQELIYQGSYQNGGTKIFKYRYIYRDNGRIINEYIVDLDGNIRSNLTGYDRNHDFNKMYPVVEYYSVPKEIRVLAQKSLD